MRTPPLWAGSKIQGPAAQCMATMGVPTTTSTINPHKLHDLPVLKTVANGVLQTAKKSVVGGGWVEVHHLGHARNFEL